MMMIHYILFSATIVFRYHFCKLVIDYKNLVAKHTYIVL